MITGAARKDLDQLPKEVLGRADTRVLALAENPRPFGSEQERLQEALTVEFIWNGSLVALLLGMTTAL